MAQIEYNLPPEILAEQDANYGVYRPGMNVTSGSFGKSLTRIWSEMNLRNYELKPIMLKQSENGLRNLKHFMNATDLGTSGFWAKEQVDGVHLGVPCGPVGDASRTCFPVPFYGAITNGIYMIDDEPQLSGVTIHSAANMLTGGDEYAQPGANNGDATDWSGAYYTPFVQHNFGLAGPHCLKCTPDGSTNIAVVMPAYQQCGAVAAPGDIVTGIVSIYETLASPRSFNVSIRYYNSSDAFVGKDDATPSAATTGEWVTYSHTAGAAPANTAYCVVSIRDETNASTTPFFADTFAVTPATYDRWHLPSFAPNVAEFSSAPALNERVTANGTGRGMARVILDRSAHAWAMSSPGHAVPNRLQAREEVEV